MLANTGEAPAKVQLEVAVTAAPLDLFVVGANYRQLHNKRGILLGEEDRHFLNIDPASPLRASAIGESGLEIGERPWTVNGPAAFLDGGIYLYRLDLATGKKLSEIRLGSRDPKTGQERKEVIYGVDMPGVLPDGQADPADSRPGNEDQSGGDRTSRGLWEA